MRVKRVLLHTPQRTIRIGSTRQLFNIQQNLTTEASLQLRTTQGPPNGPSMLWLNYLKHHHPTQQKHTANAIWVTLHPPGQGSCNTWGADDEGGESLGAKARPSPDRRSSLWLEALDHLQPSANTEVVESEDTAINKITLESSGKGANQGVCQESKPPSLMSLFIPRPPGWYKAKQEELDKLYGEGVIVPVHHEDPDAGNFAYHCELCHAKLNTIVMVKEHCKDQQHTEMKKKLLEIQKRIEARKKIISSLKQEPVKQNEETKNIETKEGQKKNQENKEMRKNSESIAVDATEEGNMTFNAGNGNSTELGAESDWCTNMNTEKRRMVMYTGKDRDAPMDTENERRVLDTEKKNIYIKKEDKPPRIKLHQYSMSTPKDASEKAAWLERQQPGKVGYDGQLKRKRISADAKSPQKHPRNHGSLGSTARHQNQSPFSSSPFSTPANDTGIPHLLQSSYLTSTSAASSGLPFHLPSSSSVDYPDTIPFEYHPDRNSLDYHPDKDFYHHHRDRDSFGYHADTDSRDHHPASNFDRYPDTIPFDCHPSSEPFYHPDKVSLDHHSEITSFSHEDTNSRTFANSPDPVLPLPAPLPPPGPRSECATACDVRTNLLRKVECCQLREEDIGATTSLITKLMTAVEDFFIHNLDLNIVCQAKQTLNEAGMQFARLKLLLNQQAPTRNFSNIL